MLVGWCSVAEIVSCREGAIRRCAKRRRDCADDELADVEEAFRMFTIVGVVFLVVVQREPTPD